MQNTSISGVRLSWTTLYYHTFTFMKRQCQFTQLVRYFGEPVSNLLLDLLVHPVLHLRHGRDVYERPLDEGPRGVGAGQEEVILMMEFKVS